MAMNQAVVEFLFSTNSNDHSFVKLIELGCVSQQTCFCSIQRRGFSSQASVVRRHLSPWHENRFRKLELDQS